MREGLDGRLYFLGWRVLFRKALPAMSRRIQSFRDLEVYQRALRQSGIVFERSNSFPKHENYALTSQIRRSSRAVSALVAEAWARHHYPRAFRNTVSQALGEVCETQAWLDHAL